MSRTYDDKALKAARRPGALFEARVTTLLIAADFDISHNISMSGSSVVDITARRTELGGTREYGIVIKLVVDGRIADEALQLFARQSNTDECWLVASQASQAARTVFDQAALSSKRYKLFEYKELERILEPFIRPIASRKKSTKPKKLIRIGKIAQLNRAEILTIAASLIALIDERLTSLQSSRPNDPDSIARKKTGISDLTRLRAQVQSLAASVDALKKGSAKEREEVERSVMTLADGVKNWWTKEHVAICSSTLSTTLFTLSVSLCSLSGVAVHGKTAAIIAGALAGGKPLIDALKGLGKIFRG